MKNILITSIQRQCFHDGPGIRTTIFLKGCSIHCPWCSNPENICKDKQYYFDHLKCLQQRDDCIINSSCELLTDKSLLNRAYLSCPVEAVGAFGVEYTPEKLYDELIKDQVYWGDEGGITLSGGEPLLQISKLEPMLKRLSEENIHIAAETALFVPKEDLKKAMKYISFFYVDVKLLIEEQCRTILGGDLKLYYNNINLLLAERKKMVFRVPCIEGYTLEAQNRLELINFFDKHKGIKVELLAGHNLGANKYRALGMQSPFQVSCEEKKLLQFYNDLGQHSIIAKICRI